MELQTLFSAENLIVDFCPSDKWQAIRDLVDHAAAQHGIGADQVEAIMEAVVSRERSMSTGMENGIAIPHAAVDELEAVIPCLGIVSTETGLPFDSIDRQPARFIVLLVIPREQKLLHIRTLADVARVLGRADVRSRLLEARTSAEAHAVFADPNRD
ncbi:MAG: mannitol/fructose-specific phosphotransferase system IIA component (Ntr-type) [Chlamydiales bacterium]|jgi:mannitol/fructose-specific phosphotransferase system IIA component (Ntr-type)